VGRHVTHAGDAPAASDSTAAFFVDPGWMEVTARRFDVDVLHFVFDVINSGAEVVEALSVRAYDTWMDVSSWPPYVDEPLLPGARRRFEIVIPIPNYWNVETAEMLLPGLEPLIAFSDSVGLWWEQSGHHGIESIRPRFAPPPPHQDLD
jgi:hypothetical protein